MLRRTLLRPSVSFDPSYSPLLPPSRFHRSFPSGLAWPGMGVAARYACGIYRARFRSAWWWSCFNHQFHDDSDGPSDSRGPATDLIHFDPFAACPVIYLGQPLLFFRRADVFGARKRSFNREKTAAGATYQTMFSCLFFFLFFFLRFHGRFLYNCLHTSRRNAYNLCIELLIDSASV